MSVVDTLCGGIVAPQAKLDIRRGLSSLLEQACKKIKHGESVWNSGLGDVVRAAINESDLPVEPITAVEAARRLGILPMETKRKRRA